MTDSFEKSLQEFEDKEITEQSLALVDVVKDLLDATKKHLNRVYILLAISIIVNLLTVFGFLWYESQFEYEIVTEETVTTETIDNSTTTTQEVSGENSEINNVNGDMYKDNAVHNE